MAKWFFKKQRPGDTTREPIQGEFFSTEAISNTAEALVREGIQNSRAYAPLFPAFFRVFHGN